MSLLLAILPIVLVGCIAGAAVPPRGYPAVSLIGMHGSGEPEFAVDDDERTVAHLRLGLGDHHAKGLAAAYERQEGEAPLTGAPLVAQLDDYFLGGMFGAGEGQCLRMPIEIGVAYAEYSALQRGTSLGVEWDSIGIRGGLEPEIILMYGGSFEVGVYGSLSGSYGAGDVTVRGASRRTSTLTWEQYGWEYGVRLQTGPLVTGIAMVGRHQSLKDDPDDAIVDQEQSFEGLLFTGGIRF